MNRRIALMLAAISAAALALPGSTLAQQKSLKDTIVGTWTVTSVSDQYDNGNKVNPWGAGMKGNLTFDANGHFTQILIGEKQASMKSDDPRRPDALALSYFGTYTVNEPDKTIIVRNEAATNSIRVGAEQKWTVSGSGDKLTLSGSPRKDQHGTFTPHLEVQRAK